MPTPAKLGFAEAVQIFGEFADDPSSHPRDLASLYVAFQKMHGAQFTKMADVVLGMTRSAQLVHGPGGGLTVLPETPRRSAPAPPGYKKEQFSGGQRKPITWDKVETLSPKNVLNRYKRMVVTHSPNFRDPYLDYRYRVFALAEAGDAKTLDALGRLKDGALILNVGEKRRESFQWIRDVGFEARSSLPAVVKMREREAYQERKAAARKAVEAFAARLRGFKGPSQGNPSLRELSLLYAGNAPVPFGKHLGKRLEDLPLSYLEWLDRVVPALADFSVKLLQFAESPVRMWDLRVPYLKQRGVRSSGDSVFDLGGKRVRDLSHGQRSSLERLAASMASQEFVEVLGRFLYEPVVRGAIDRLQEHRQEKWDLKYEEVGLQPRWDRDAEAAYDEMASVLGQVAAPTVDPVTGRLATTTVRLKKYPRAYSSTEQRFPEQLTESEAAGLRPWEVRPTGPMSGKMLNAMIGGRRARQKAVESRLDDFSPIGREWVLFQHMLLQLEEAVWEVAEIEDRREAIDRFKLIRDAVRKAEEVKFQGLEVYTKHVKRSLAVAKNALMSKKRMKRFNTRFELERAAADTPSRGRRVIRKNLEGGD